MKIVFVRILALAASFLFALPSPGWTQALHYAGRPLAEVIRELQTRGLNIVFSSELVKADMRVTVEPKATAPRRILEEVIVPHGLRIVSGPKGALLVVRAGKAPRNAPPSRQVGAISGIVTDKRTGQPLPGVTIAVQGLSLSTTTGSDGRFQLANVPAEPQFLFVSLVGYGLARPAVNVEPEKDTEVTIALADGVGTFSEEITVLTDRFRAVEPAAPTQQMLTNADFQDLRGVLADDPQRAVQSLPGVATGDDFRSEFSVRGSEFRHIGLSIDDIPVGWLVHSARGLQDTGSISILNGDIIEAGTLFAGPYAQRYPGRLGAWLAYELREGSRTRTEGHLSVSGTATSLAMNGPIGGAQRGSWIVSARQSYLQWLIDKLDPEGNAAFGFTDVAAKLVYDVTSSQQLQFFTLAGRASLKESEEQPGPNSLSTGINRTAVAALGWRSAFRSTVLTQRLSFRGADFKNTGRFEQALGDGRETQLAYSADVDFNLGRGFSWRNGGRIERSNATETLRQFAFAAAPGVVQARSTNAAASSAWLSNAYTGFTWENERGAAADFGAGVTGSSETGSKPISAWLLGAYPLSGSFLLRAGASLARQFPETAQIARQEGFRFTALGPERALSMDAGIEHRLSPSLRWQLTLYSRNERDVLRLAGSEPRLEGGAIVRPGQNPLWRNALEGVSRGVEVVLQRRSPTGLSGWIGYSYGRAKYTDVSTGERFWADFDQRHSLNVYGQYRASAKTSLSGKLRVGSNFPLQGYFTHSGGTLTLAATKNEVRLPVYSRLDFRINHSFTYARRRLTLFCEVLNVLGHSNIGPSDGTVRTNGTVSSYTEKLLPFLPSAGFVFDF
jgi:hypothetical protein